MEMYYSVYPYVVCITDLTLTVYRYTQKVQSEIDDVTGGSRQPLMADCPNMPYTNAVILETQRIRPVVPLAVPHQTRDDTTLDGYTIPKKTCKSLD